MSSHNTVLYSILYIQSSLSYQWGNRTLHCDCKVTYKTQVCCVCMLAQYVNCNVGHCTTRTSKHFMLHVCPGWAWIMTHIKNLEVWCQVHLLLQQYYVHLFFFFQAPSQLCKNYQYPHNLMGIILNLLYCTVVCLWTIRMLKIMYSLIFT